jgi:hypothetical protein
MWGLKTVIVRSAHWAVLPFSLLKQKVSVWIGCFPWPESGHHTWVSQSRICHWVMATHWGHTDLTISHYISSLNRVSHFLHSPCPQANDLQSHELLSKTQTSSPSPSWVLSPFEERSHLCWVVPHSFSSSQVFRKMILNPYMTTMV